MTDVLPSKVQSNGEEKAKSLKKRRRESGALGSTTNDPHTKLSKEERRETKRLRKLDKDNGSGSVANVEERTLALKNVSEDDGGSAKAARKAEKARLKAAKRAEKEESNNTTEQEPADLDGDSTKRLKDRNKSKRSSAPQYIEDPVLTALPESEIEDFLSTHAIKIDDSNSTPLRPVTKFSYLPSDTTSDSSSFASFKSPTPIQSAAWPFLLSGRDVIGVAETGSGKTLAFGVPCIRSISSSPLPSKSGAPARAVIVSPTRELAVQIHTQIEKLATPASLSTVCVYGGVPKDAQRAALKTAHIIVATPGRLNDLINEGAADLGSVNYCVLDEADRMLDKGFEQEIRKIIATTPAKGRQTLMFTATWPPSVRELATTFMNQPVHISIGADNPTGELRANTKIKQLVEVVDPRGKEQRLLQLLKNHTAGSKKNDRILIFCLYKKEAARVEGFLRSRGLKVAGIHGDMGQAARTTSFESFKSGESPLLVATDVAARGWDIPNVKVVVNVTFPLTVEDYVHRIGRTGRAGAEGLAITLFTEHDKALSGALINVLRAAGQEIPDELLRFGSTVKKKGHEAYGAFYKDVGEGEMKKAKKIVFD
ncbi:ATP-dependent RNA helicase DBP3, partial [Lecanoromycetidae sp. Uapishka_2]